MTTDTREALQLAQRIVRREGEVQADGSVITWQPAVLMLARALIAAADAQVTCSWQPIETAPKDRLIIGALIVDGVVWRVHDMKHSGLAFYTKNGGSLPRMTHWMEMPVHQPVPVSEDA